MLRIWMLSCLTLACATESEILNRQVTELVRLIIDNIQRSENDIIKPPDLPLKEWNSSQSLDSKGQLSCKSGWVKSLTSLKRIGSPVMWKDDDEYVIQVRSEFDNLSIGFDECQVHVGDCYANTTKIVGQNIDHSIDLPISLRGDGPTCENDTTKIESENILNFVVLQFVLIGKGSACVASVEYVGMPRVGTIIVNSKNEKLQQIWRLVEKWIWRHFQRNVPRDIKKVLQKVVNRSLQKVDLCSTLPKE